MAKGTTAPRRPIARMSRRSQVEKLTAAAIQGMLTVPRTRPEEEVSAVLTLAYHVLEQAIRNDSEVDMGQVFNALDTMRRDLAAHVLAKAAAA